MEFQTRFSRQKISAPYWTGRESLSRGSGRERGQQNQEEDDRKQRRRLSITPPSSSPLLAK